MYRCDYCGSVDEAHVCDELRRLAAIGAAVDRLPDDFPLTIRYDPLPAIIAWTVEVAGLTGYGNTITEAIEEALR